MRGSIAVRCALTDRGVDSQKVRTHGAVGLILVAAACAPAPPPPPPTARHVVLVTIDTLRADRLGCYGSDVATPRLDRIASQGALALEASAHVPLTRPSHVSIFTGLLPSQHGIRDNVSPPLGADQHYGQRAADL